jgi:hypothetical protein
MILCSAFLFVSLATACAAKLSWFGLTVVRADYGKFFPWSNRNLKKNSLGPSIKHCVRRPALASSCCAGTAASRHVRHE